MSLAQKNYSQIESTLTDETTDQLFKLLDSPSVKIGDTAADLLIRRGEAPELLRHALANRFRTAKGKIRALHILANRGRLFPEAITAFFHFLDDKNYEVANEALFYLVLWNEKQHIDTLRNCKNKIIEDRIKVAVSAIEANDYTIYSPHFRSDERWNKS